MLVKYPPAERSVAEQDERKGKGKTREAPPTHLNKAPAGSNQLSTDIVPWPDFLSRSDGSRAAHG